MKRSRLRLYLAAVAVALLLLFFYGTGVIGNTSLRVWKDHAISLPPSASNLHCDGTVSLNFIDEFEGATFEMSRDELSSLMAQLDRFTAVRQDTEPPFTDSGHLVTTACGMSPKSNFLRVAVYEIDAKRVRVHLSTFWG